MQIKKVLNEKEIREIEEIIEKNYGCKINLRKYKIFLTREDKIWLVNKKLNFDIFRNIKRCYRIGIYFGKLKRNKKIKLSIEGALLVGKRAVKNIAILDDKEALRFMQGYDAKVYELLNCEINNFVLVKNNNDVIGVGILRDGYIENLVPKARRISF